jgi:hypothetical protein
MSRWAAGPAPSWKVPRSNVGPPPENIVVAKAESSKAPEATATPRSSGAIARQRPLPDYDSISEQPIPRPQDVPAEGPGVGKSNVPNASATPASAGTAPKLEIADSLRSLTGPPSSLGATSAAANGPDEQANKQLSASNGRLTNSEVVGLADAAAQTKGYDLNHYQRSDPQFDGIDNTWLVSYDAKPDSAQSAKRLNVAVDDKSKRTAVVPGH